MGGRRRAGHGRLLYGGRVAARIKTTRRVILGPTSNQINTCPRPPSFSHWFWSMLAFCACPLTCCLARWSWLVNVCVRTSFIPRTYSCLVLVAGPLHATTLSCRLIITASRCPPSLVCSLYRSCRLLSSSHTLMLALLRAASILVRYRRFSTRTAMHFVSAVQRTRSSRP